MKLEWKDKAKEQFKKAFGDIKKEPKVISICQNKGGVAKTTSSINIAVALSYIGKVLLIDNDSQSNLSQTFNMDISQEFYSLYDVFLKPEIIKDSIRNIFDNLDIISNNTFYDDYLDENKDIHVLKNILGLVKNDYHFIIIDTAPTLAAALKMSIIASDFFLVPTTAAPLSLQNIRNTYERANNLNKEYNLNVKNLGTFITMLENRNLSRSIISFFNDNKEFNLFDTKIRKAVAIEESQAVKLPIFDYAPDSNPASDYYNLTFEILERIKQYE